MRKTKSTWSCMLKFSMSTQFGNRLIVHVISRNTPPSPRVHIALSFDDGEESQETLLAGFGLKISFDSQKMNLELCPKDCPKNNVFFVIFNARSPFDRHFFEWWSVDFSMILRSSRDDTKCGSHFSFASILAREMMMTDPVLGLVNQLNFPYLYLSFIIPSIVSS